MRPFAGRDSAGANIAIRAYHWHTLAVGTLLESVSSLGWWVGIIGSPCLHHPLDSPRLDLLVPSPLLIAVSYSIPWTY